MSVGRKEHLLICNSMTYQKTGLEYDATIASDEDECRANCRIWAHMLFWWMLPFGWILSVYKMRNANPAYVMLAMMCLSVLTPLPEQTGASVEEQLTASFQVGQKYGIVGGIIGSAVTVQSIVEARKNVEAAESLAIIYSYSLSRR